MLRCYELSPNFSRKSVTWKLKISCALLLASFVRPKQHRKCGSVWQNHKLKAGTAHPITRCAWGSVQLPCPQTTVHCIRTNTCSPVLTASMWLSTVSENPGWHQTHAGNELYQNSLKAARINQRLVCLQGGQPAKRKAREMDLSDLINKPHFSHHRH